jgi:hypothetical protein
MGIRRNLNSTRVIPLHVIHGPSTQYCGRCGAAIRVKDWGDGMSHRYSAWCPACGRSSGRGDVKSEVIAAVTSEYRGQHDRD